jgi:hypothetical protein
MTKKTNESQEHQIVNIQDILREAGISQEEPKVEEKTADEILAELVPGFTAEPTVPVEVPQAIIEEETPKQTSSKYAEKLKEYVTLGLLEDMALDIVDGETSTQVFMSELADCDEETYNEIISQYKASRDKDIKENYVPKSDIDERTAKYIEYKKAGGDPSKLIEQEIQYVNPISKYDLENEEHQEKLVRIKLQEQKVDPRVIDLQIKLLKEDQTLDLEAKDFAKTVNESFDSYLESKKQEQIALDTKEKAEQKEFKKNIGIELKALVADENITKVILENTTKRNEYGLTNTDQIFFDLQQKDPKAFAEIALFLNNREAFIKTITSKTKTTENLKIVNKLLTINPSVKKAITKPAEKEESLGEEVFKRITSQFKQ